MNKLKFKIMKIKVGDKIYDGENEPVMVILTKKDKENIANMLSSCHKYCQYPDTYNSDEIIEWMEDVE